MLRKIFGEAKKLPVEIIHSISGSNFCIFRKPVDDIFYDKKFQLKILKGTYLKCQKHVIFSGDSPFWAPRKRGHFSSVPVSSTFHNAPNVIHFLFFHL